MIIKEVGDSGEKNESKIVNGEKRERWRRLSKRSRYREPVWVKHSPRVPTPVRALQATAASRTAVQVGAGQKVAIAAGMPAQIVP